MIGFNIKNGVLVALIGNEPHIVIPNDVTEINTWALRDYPYLTSVKIPSSVTRISYALFYGCTSLTSIEIPNSVTSIGESAFMNCANLTHIEIPSSVTEIGNFAFSNCTSLTNIEIPNSVMSIGYRVFSGCTSLTNIKIPNSVTSIYRYAFANLLKVKPQYNAEGKLRAFKAFNADWSCLGFKYAVGKSFHQDGIIRCCCNGFHACPNPLDVFNHYSGYLNKLRFAEVELSGKMDSENEKVAASDIRIVRELTVSELAKIYNAMEKVYF